MSLQCTPKDMCCHAASRLLNASNSDSLREEALHKADGIEGLQVVH